MNFIGNIIWLICGSILGAVLWFIAGLLLCLTIIGIPSACSVLRLPSLFSGLLAEKLNQGILG